MTAMEMCWRFPIRRSPLICQKQKNVLPFAVTDYRGCKWRVGEDETGHRYVIAAPVDLRSLLGAEDRLCATCRPQHL
ncbi:hypothetical protein [Mesorhizobium sp.]|uniref:hypothetical protein n=1 Tax=Mesorhizobium sp. TaxID=1871066 RepID=UPI000FE7008C|nr:hypothetical protein [Mesorhizobium sp.]RWO23914.1 MAG: hypothetical protein EOS09_14960 [Mesorhizobium sp.]